MEVHEGEDYTSEDSSDDRVVEGEDVLAGVKANIPPEVFDRITKKTDGDWDKFKRHAFAEKHRIKGSTIIKMSPTAEKQTDDDAVVEIDSKDLVGSGSK